MSGIQDTNSFTIIQAEMPQLDIVAPLFDKYRQFYKQPSDLDLARKFLKARVQNRDSVIFLAMDEDIDDDIGLGFTLLYPSFNSVRATPIWILNDIFVDDSARKRGIGKALIERGRNLVQDTGADQMSLATGRDNTASHRLYESLGFKRDEYFCTYLLDL